MDDTYQKFIQKENEKREALQKKAKQLVDGLLSLLSDEEKKEIGLVDEGGVAALVSRLVRFAFSELDGEELIDKLLRELESPSEWTKGLILFNLRANQLLGREEDYEETKEDLEEDYKKTMEDLKESAVKLIDEIMGAVRVSIEGGAIVAREGDPVYNVLQKLKGKVLQNLKDEEVSVEDEEVSVEDEKASVGLSSNVSKEEFLWHMRGLQERIRSGKVRESSALMADIVTDLQDLKVALGDVYSDLFSRRSGEEENEVNVSLEDIKRLLF